MVGMQTPSFFQCCEFPNPNWAIISEHQLPSNRLARVDDAFSGAFRIHPVNPIFRRMATRDNFAGKRWKHILTIPKRLSEPGRKCTQSLRTSSNPASARKNFAKNRICLWVASKLYPPPLQFPTLPALVLALFFPVFVIRRADSLRKRKPTTRSGQMMR